MQVGHLHHVENQGPPLGHSAAHDVDVTGAAGSPHGYSSMAGPCQGAEGGTLTVGVRAFQQ
jgi:hypothetical protein